MTEDKPRYAGTVHPEPGTRYPDSLKSPLIFPYLPAPELVEAVNLAIALERPLLLKGEPGCGKTQLARAVAFELNLPYFDWYIKSTSRARDGVYVYDAVARLRDAQLAAHRKVRAGGARHRDDPMSYVRFGTLGQAFLSDQPPVLLIDEIDKADIDFPNDLLLELDEKRIVLEEVDGRSIPAKHPPLVFITSNDEKDLPPAFLRRCLFFHIEFPRPEELIGILRSRFADADTTLVDKAVERFWNLRQQMAREKSAAAKRVSTSELIDWFRALLNLSHLSLTDALAAIEGKALPFSETLLKSVEDIQQYSGRAKS